MAYYRRIRDMREDHDLTQWQLASILNMPQPQYNRYEQGLRDIPTTVLVQLPIYIILRPTIFLAVPKTLPLRKPNALPCKSRGCCLWLLAGYVRQGVPCFCFVQGRAQRIL